ncbi:TSUP family transporter [Terasakiispira papahanaumokuakeensis]|uniref:TSUP family transporter n=1 Tax=Terasakiispira papahanaumokuakeensis TaxID=197479 RepID=UPI000AC1D12A|nr:TSUP family transporter [Terasakiispira papahanaumokuakeensis]
MIDLSMDVVVMLGFVALVAGFIDTLAGGGGLITIPALLLAGVPPLQALATNKIQAVAGTFTSTSTLLRRRLLRWSQVRALFVSALLGSAVGALCVQFIDANSLDIIIPVVLGAIALYYLLAPRAGDVDTVPRVGPAFYRFCVVPVIGFYDGMFGPGTGSFFSTAGVALRGQALVKATLNAKVMNFATNLAAVLVFVFSGHVVWLAGLSMMLGQACGAWLGTHAVVLGGTRLIKPILVSVCLVMLGRYFWEQWA